MQFRSQLDTDQVPSLVSRPNEMIARVYPCRIITRYRDDDGAEPRLCERAILTSGTKCTATVVLCDENGKRHPLCLPRAVQHLSGDQDLLASAVIELALTIGISMNAWESAG